MKQERGREYHRVAAQPNDAKSSMHLNDEGSFVTLQIDPVIPAESLPSFDGRVSSRNRGL
jgi:hypothetical protein